jgi:hypothetical protein
MLSSYAALPRVWPGAYSVDKAILLETQMKILLIMALTLVASDVFAADCTTTATGKTVCKDGATAATVNPTTGTVTTRQAHPSGVTTAGTNTGAATTQKYASGVTTAHSNSGAKAAYNPHTGASAVEHTNGNGVKATQTSRGGQAKTKNGMGVAEAPNGTKCYKGANTKGCKP